MAYDMAPYDSIQIKGELLRRAAADGWTVFFDHDAERKAVRVGMEGDLPVPLPLG
jgi:hypothetical protein